MNYEELLSFLDIEDPSEFVYFEQFAELIESGDDISLEAIKQLIRGMDEGILAELTEGYFDDILRFVPDEEAELYTLLQTIETTLSTLAQSGDNETSEDGDTESNTYADELYKFRNWYVVDSCVICIDREEETETEIPLMEALTNYRVRNYVEDEYSYDYSNALDYELDEYIVSLSSLTNDYDDDDNDYDDVNNSDDGFFDDDPAVDDFYDDDEDMDFEDEEFDD